MESSCSASNHFDDHPCFSFQVDISKHAIVQDDGILCDRFLVPSSSSTSNPPYSPSRDQELIRNVVAALSTDCLSDLIEIEAVEAERYRQEKRMMKPLNKLFHTIEKEAAKHCKNRAHFRAFVRTDDPTLDAPLVNDDLPFDSPAIVKPDFVLVDLPSPTHSSVVPNLSDSARRHIDWRQCTAFAVVKAKSLDLPHPSPTPSTEEDVESYGDNLPTLTECSNHAGQLVVRRPPLLSTYALFICGNAFCIALCDRSGIVLSPVQHLPPAADLECFVRVVLRFTWEMSSGELGEDPTTRLAGGHTRHQEEYPHYDVGMGRSPGLDLEETAHCRWTTVGGPLWASHALLGRGTSVWPALDLHKTPLILKVSWQAVGPGPGRRSETEVHDILRSFLRNAGVEVSRGLVLASAGGDVYDDSEKVMSVSNLRNVPEEKYKAVVDCVLHRVCFTRFGKPIWRYSSLQEFARAMRDALEAHETLSGYGILHRDISAGHILIDIDASYKATTATEPEGIVLKDRDPQNSSGFLSGWESVWFPQGVLDVAANCPQNAGHIEPELDMSTKVTAVQGTPMFLATEVLFGLSDKRQLVRSRVHALESFEWVILYSIYAHSIKTAFEDSKVPRDKATKLMEEFQNIFAAIEY